jgi:hypothetical protein
MIKVEDIVDFKQETVQEISQCCKKLDGLCREYSEIDGIGAIGDLEILKRRFVGEFQYFAKLFSHVKKYKGASHTYLEDQRKQIKAEGINKVMAEKGNLSITAAKELVYDTDFYKQRIDVIQSLIKFFIKTENMYDYYTSVFQSIIQSVSIASKEKNIN